MAAILPAPVPVNVELLTAVRASEIVDRLTLHLVEMAVPPLVTALVAAEAFFLLLGDLPNLPAAVLAGGCIAGECNGSLGCRVPVDIIPAAERLYCVHRDANRLGNLAIAVSSRTEFDDLRFLIIGHILSAPSEG
nr:MAG: hypothetical protein [Bacteriophage sp.]UVY60224.1 MAG: hypothetical protein [Bacteriophage sp.]UWF95168.1 MAG: hypothetical protein [Bacteriophage sp.]UWG16254.1 MAG: hypothetical protein [Bacteriophage sp.]